MGTLVAGRSELLLLRKIFKEWFFRVAVCCYYTIITDSYLLSMDKLSFFDQNYNDFHIWELFPFLGTWCKFQHYFVFQSFVHCNFSRQPVALSGDSIPLERFSQTSCLEMLILVKNFPRQSVTIIGELVPFELFWHTNSVIHLTSFWFLNVYSRFLKQKKLIDSSAYGWFFILCLVCPFMVFLCMV